MNIIQAILHEIEVGKARAIARIAPLAVTLLVVALFYDCEVYHGLNDAQSMDNAQLARQVATGSGFTTKFLRPLALVQLNEHAAQTTGKLFPANQFPAGTPRIIPDTYNAPGYPYLLAGWFQLIRPQFDQTWQEIGTKHMYSGDIFIPVFNQIFILLTAFFVFGLSRVLFDERVAWISLMAFLGSDIIWQYSITALSTNVLIFLVTALLFVSLKLFCVAEDHFENDEPFWPAWIWALIASLLLAAACLTRLHLLVLLVPLLLFVALVPRTNFLLLPLVAIIVIGLVVPWFWHMYAVCGNPLGSNLSQLLYGEDRYKDNQIFCQTSIPGYEQMLKGLSRKELLGFSWHFEHGWDLLGSNPMILLFAASILHRFRRRRVNAFRWFIIGSAFCIIAVNNMGTSSPATIGPWNTLVVLFPAMVVIGSAFFFILLDRLDLQLWLLNNTAIIAVVGLITAPLILTISGRNNNTRYYNYPPYVPFFDNQVAHFVRPDEWVTSDMPWATAWYGDRASLWLPDSVKDFENFHDTYCPTGIMLLTPVTWDAPMSNLTSVSGEYHEWLPIVIGVSLPPSFPLPAFTNYSAQAADYYLWSDVPRWNAPVIR